VVTFDETMGGLAVMVNGKPFGHISKEHGFFTDSTVIREFIKVSASELREIAKKSEEEERAKH